MNLLPTAQVGDEPGFFGPDYDFAGSLPTPKNVGVRRDNSLSSVIDATRGAAYYVDMIGFGEPSNSFTQALGNKPKPLGINYFIRTGIRCSNGADMWHYVEGIPTGNAFGGRIKEALKESGLPSLRGLAPGILEDAQDALDPRPVMNAVLGSGYPKCRLVELPVGDQDGNLGIPGEDPWIKGPVSRGYGYPTQKKWVQDIDRKGRPINITREEYDKGPKMFCPDGSPIGNGSCVKKEGFAMKQLSVGSDTTQLVIVVSLIAAACIAVCKLK